MEVTRPTASPARPAPSPGSPYFSVVVSTWQRREFLETAVRSVLAQTVPRSDFEVLVVKGFSDPELEARLARSGVQLLRTPSASIGITLTIAFAACHGTVVTFLDDDDEFEPGKLAYLRRAFETEPELAALRNGNRCIDARGRRLPEWPDCSWPSLPRHDVAELRTAHEKRHRPSLPMHNLSSISVRRSAVEPFFGAWPEIEGASDSMVLLSALGSPGVVRADPVPLTRRRIHASVSMDSYSAGGLGPPSDLERMRRLRRAHARQVEMVRGTPAEPTARWLEVIHRFEAAMAAPELPPPSAADYAVLLRGIVRERQPFRLWTLGFALARRVFPRRSVDAWWAFSRRSVARTIPSIDYGSLFSHGTGQPSRTNPRTHH